MASVLPSLSFFAVMDQWVVGGPAICLPRVDVTGLEMSDGRRHLTAIEVFELFVTKERRSL